MEFHRGPGVGGASAVYPNEFDPQSKPGFEREMGGIRIKLVDPLVILKPFLRPQPN